MSFIKKYPKAAPTGSATPEINAYINAFVLSPDA